MTNIEHRVTKYELHRELRRFLHDPIRFPGQLIPSRDPTKPSRVRKMNFRVQLEEGIAPTRNNGKGFLTLPEESYARDFLRFVRKGEIRVIINNRTVKFEKASRRSSSSLIEELRRTLYQDPSIEEEREEKIRFLDHSLRIDKLEFGVWGCRPSPGHRGIFRSEWRKSYTQVGDAHVKFDYDQKAIRIQIGDAYKDEIAYIVTIRVLNTRNIWVGDGIEGACMLPLSTLLTKLVIMNL